MNSVREIVEALGGPTKFGRICGFLKNPGARGSDILARGSIPVDYWPCIVDYATANALPIDNDCLVRIHALRVPRRRQRILEKRVA
ncbi:hypothetical protein [Methylobacterium haplocladii]|uniref:Uncharacterized protein n=1 Tax=Methylobacterium haplocladii TaxID=1176176 RepID=A0A512IS78_9HYPH|nr:hypothetical protein [Methylobacterium haplocladii]GEP00565.1 hypothetical protein MHA02_29520 [Methylobacterium haplocladii]GJD85480.1 hypothetical protein HPGCJGGD_3369 [Methylobacterium haplocladii]GLS57713.1 hypothetical protein GCM10007887_03690 [Methylobacterium haplocladii]